MLLQFIFSFLSTMGFAILFNIPKKSVLLASFGGAMGWIFFMYFHNQFQSLVFASFMGACVVAIISEIFARKFREAVTVFVIPGILPLVPGTGMYYTMIAIIEQNFTKSASIGTETIFVAGSIALAISIVSSICRMIIQIQSKL